MSYYNLNWNDASGILSVSFGDQKAHNDIIIVEAREKAFNLVDSVMGRVIKLNGPVSVPVSFMLSNVFGNKALAIAVYDPKIERPVCDPETGEKKMIVGGYVVSVSSSLNYAIGDVID